MMRTTAGSKRAWGGGLAAIALTGCPGRGDELQPSPAAAVSVLDCPEQVFDVSPSVGSPFRHRRSHVLAAAASARHIAPDVLARPGSRATVMGKFMYGEIGKDLEDEMVEVFLGGCDAWTPMGRERSDDDGRVSWLVDVPTTLGRYPLVARVQGDGSSARATLTVAPSGTPLVVFDLDGTLTTSDVEITRDVIDDRLEQQYEQQTYPGGVELTRAWAARGYLIVYLSGRPYWLTDFTRRWLEREGYAAGHLVVTDRHREVVPNAVGVGAFKTRVLQGLLDHGYRIVAAHGNALTDVQAYAAAGVAKDRTYIIGEHGGAEGTQAVAPDWRALAASIEHEPAGSFGAPAAGG